jgi:hypothetical protein
MLYRIRTLKFQKPLDPDTILLFPAILPAPAPEVPGFFHLPGFKKGDICGRCLHPVLPERELQEGVFPSRFPVIPVAASCGGQDVDNCLENRDDDVKEQVPVKHFFAHLLCGLYQSVLTISTIAFWLENLYRYRDT